MQKNKSYLLLYLIAFSAITVWMGCTARRLEKDEVLLKKVIIKCDNTKISKEDMYGYLKQKPNRKLFGFNVPHLFKRGAIGRKGLLTDGAGYPFYLAIHNLVNPKRELRRETRRDLRYQKKQARYVNNPKTKKGKSRREPKKHRTIGEFLYAIGEPPVMLDSSKTSRSVNQIASYLNNKGYFHSTVSDTLIYPLFQRKKHNKVIQCYIIHPATAYTLRAIKWEIQDENIAYDLMTDTASEFCLLKFGANYDVDVFEQERDRITKSLRNNGYYKFSKDYIHYSLDSTLGSHQVDVTIIIRKQQYQVNDSTWVETNHQRFAIRNIYVKSLFDLQQLRDDKDFSNYDTTIFKEIFLLRNADSLDKIPIEKLLKFKPEVLASRISFRTNLPFRQNDYEATYRQLTSLRVFKQVVIDPVEVGGDKLDIYIKLFPVSKQSFTAQVEGTTNSGSNFGIGGSYGYQNNNLFRGAEILQFSVKAGTEVQHTLAATQQTNTTGLDFNTIQLGAEASLNIPREFFPFNLLVTKNKTEEKRTTQDRRTVFLASFNYQKRSDYDRSLGNLSYGYTFRYKKNGKVSFFPIELNVVKVTPKAGLLELLQNPDPLLHYRFTDHLIRDFRITYLYSKETKRHDILYFKIDGETSGLLLRPLFELSKATPNANGSYEIAGIPFAHYVRLLLEGKINKSIGDHQRLVGRGLIGYGYALSNFPTLPLEKSFYAGGANGIRAWEARTLGPGSYIIPNDQKYAQFGDIQLEYNLELRFRITKTLNGAAFIDGGNVWTLKADPSRVNADFSFKQLRFINDLAFGPGLGLRYDLSFFIVRLDWAFKLRDPSMAVGERWYVPGQRKLGSNLNFGIGYPF
ncbi:MAG: BamA/TamA family outer membrane protein [Bacteroidetes bacterium]|nr:BamA/TamA family outer membrane protein [Bacteroidota bacterium]